MAQVCSKATALTVNDFTNCSELHERDSSRGMSCFVELSVKLGWSGSLKSVWRVLTQVANRSDA